MRLNRKIEAFTIFEVTVVVGILSVLITIISLTINRMNEQMHGAQKVTNELNEWYLVRSNIWRECYNSDSMEVSSNQCNIYFPKKTVSYKVINDTLYWNIKDDWRSLKIPVESIQEKSSGSSKTVEFDFIWKGTVMKMSYLSKPVVKYQIDQYFYHLNE